MCSDGYVVMISFYLAHHFSHSKPGLSGYESFYILSGAVGYLLSLAEFSFTLKFFFSLVLGRTLSSIPFQKKKATKMEA